MHLRQVAHMAYALLVGGLLFGLGASYLTTGPADAWWHVGVAVAALGLLGVARLTAGYGARWVGYALTLALVVLVVAAWRELAFGTMPAAEQVLFFDNINLLAASLVVLSVAALVLLRGGVGWLAVVVALSGVALTGSRTALLALLLACVVALLVMGASRWVRLAAAAALAAVLVGFGSLWWLEQVPPERNLLRSSSDFNDVAWWVWGGASVAVTPRAAPGPYQGAWASRIRATSANNARLVLLSSVGPSQRGVPYIASVYLRASEPQQVILSSQLAWTTCELTTTWQRCVTPVGTGDGYSYLQLRFETLEPGGSFDVYAWGAQVEVGEGVSPLEERGRNRLAALLSRQFAKESFWQDEARLCAFSAAWGMFLAHPVAGLGFGQYRQQFEAFDGCGLGVVLSHAHNLPLQLLAETGILGLLSWAIPFFGVLALGWRRHWRRLLPLVVAVLVLNTLDFSFYSKGVYYVYWLTVGLILFSPRPEAEGGRQAA